MPIETKLDEYCRTKKHKKAIDERLKKLEKEILDWYSVPGEHYTRDFNIEINRKITTTLHVDRIEDIV